MSNAGWYRTSYSVNADEFLPRDSKSPTGAYGTHIWAPSLAAARRIVVARNLYETLWEYRPEQRRPYLRLSRMIQIESPHAKIMHASCYLGWVASRSGVITATQLLADEGLIHQISHVLALIDGPAVPNKKQLIAKVEALEMLVPGYCKGYREP